MSDDSEDWEITPEDIAREQERMRENTSKYPSLALVTKKHDEGYDPDQAPQNPSQAAFRRRLGQFIDQGPSYESLNVEDAPSGIFVEFTWRDENLELHASNLDVVLHAGFAEFVDSVHDHGLKIIDASPCGYNVVIPSLQVGYLLALVGLRAMGALANTLQVKP